MFSLKGHAGKIVCVAFSPDSQRVASGSADATVRIWDSATGKESFALKGHAKGVRTVAFSPDSQRLASGSEDRTVKIWESATGKELFSLRGHVGVVSVEQAAAAGGLSPDESNAVGTVPANELLP